MTYDAIIIGTGQAGPPLAARLAGSGWKTAVIERHLFGGTCVNTGCTPTKAMVASARAAHMARRASAFGVELNGDLRVDMKKVKARMDQIVRPSREGVEQWMRNTDNITVYTGHAILDSPTTVAVNGKKLEAEKIFVDVGGRAHIPDHTPGLGYWTHSSILEVDFLPEHLLIIGGGPVGLEFGQMYRRFGSRVTIIEKTDRLLPQEDEDVAQIIAETLKKEGIDLQLSAECIQGRQEKKGVVMDVLSRQGDLQLRGTHLLYATGRRPNTDDLGLGNAGVATDAQGYIRVNERLETNVPGIWALGDCNGRGAFTHTAYNDYEIVADNLLNNADRRVSDRIPCYALFIDPPLARVGMNEQEARNSGRKVRQAIRPMSKVSRAREKSETVGVMKILVDKDTEEILGATLLGVGADEVIHSIIDLMYAQQPYTLLRRVMHIHPTVSEIIPTMLKDLQTLEKDSYY